MGKSWYDDLSKVSESRREVFDLLKFRRLLTKRRRTAPDVVRENMASTLESWAVPRLQQLLPLDEDSLKQIITYTDTLPKDVAAEHLKNMLGDSPQAFEFISTFNMRRQRAPNQAAPKPSPAQQQASNSNNATPRTASPASGTFRMLMSAIAIAKSLFCSFTEMY